MFFSWIKKHLPSRQAILNSKQLHWMHTWLQKRPYLWRFTKHSVAGGVAASLLVAFIPLPLEMILAALIALLMRVNLPIAVISTWLTNPLTFIPANYLIYKVGQFVLRENGDSHDIAKFKFDWHHLGRTWEQFIAWLPTLGKAYLIGFPIVSFSAAIIGYVLVYGCWTGYELLSGKKKGKK